MPKALQRLRSNTPPGRGNWWMSASSTAPQDRRPHSQLDLLLIHLSRLPSVSKAMQVCCGSPASLLTIGRKILPSCLAGILQTSFQNAHGALSFSYLWRSAPCLTCCCLTVGAIVLLSSEDDVSCVTGCTTGVASSCCPAVCPASCPAGAAAELAGPWADHVAGV